MLVFSKALPHTHAHLMQSVNSNPWASDLCSGSWVQISPEPSVSVSPKLRSSSSLQTCDSSCLYSRSFPFCIYSFQAEPCESSWASPAHTMPPVLLPSLAVVRIPQFLLPQYRLDTFSSFAFPLPLLQIRPLLTSCLCSCPASELVAWLQQSGPNCLECPS